MALALVCHQTLPGRRVMQIEHQRIDAIDRDSRLRGPNHLQVRSGIGEAEDRAVLPEACLEALQHRQPDKVALELDGLVVVRACSADPHRTDREVLGSAADCIGWGGYRTSLGDAETVAVSGGKGNASATVTVGEVPVVRAAWVWWVECGRG